MTEKHLSFVRGLFPESPGLSPVLISIDAAGAIADVKGPYESYDYSERYAARRTSRSR